MASASDGDAEVSASQLPPEIQLDRFLMQADQAVEDRDAHAARSAMDRIVALQEEHGMEPALEDHFRCAQAWQLAGEPQRALVAVTTYLQLLGRDAPRYREALRLLNEVEGGTSRPAADSVRAFRWLGPARRGAGGAGGDGVRVDSGWEIPNGFYWFRGI